MSIVIFGNTSTCEPCRQLKQYLNANGLDYEYKDLGTIDPIKRIEWKKEAMSLGIKSIPIIFIDDNEPIVGFNIEKIEEILKK
jgi:glutaredoxin